MRICLATVLLQCLNLGVEAIRRGGYYQVFERDPRTGMLYNLNEPKSGYAPILYQDDINRAKMVYFDHQWVRKANGYLCEDPDTDGKIWFECRENFEMPDGTKYVN